MFFLKWKWFFFKIQILIKACAYFQPNDCIKSSVLLDFQLETVKIMNAHRSEGEMGRAPRFPVESPNRKHVKTSTQEHTEVFFSLAVGSICNLNEKEGPQVRGKGSEGGPRSKWGIPEEGRLPEQSDFGA